MKVNSVVEQEARAAIESAVGSPCRGLTENEIAAHVANWALERSVLAIEGGASRAGIFDDVATPRWAAAMLKIAAGIARRVPSLERKLSGLEKKAARAAGRVEGARQKQDELQALGIPINEGDPVARAAAKVKSQIIKLEAASKTASFNFRVVDYAVKVLPGVASRVRTRAAAEMPGREAFVNALPEPSKKRGSDNVIVVSSGPR